MMSAIDEYRTVNTLNGAVRGKQSVTLFDRKPFYAFRGIPYAQSPIGELRFKAPKPVHSWTDVMDTFEYGNQCIQMNFLTKVITGSEDCLFLNVYVPENLSHTKLPVMFFIHGGGFSTGSANGYGPDFLIDNDVILVTINYRLNIFGFISLGTPEYSGNMGLKDQWLALKWVNDNIGFFGGDKSKITIFGESAGSASVNYHVISPKSRGLFQRAILQSGSVLNPWTRYFDNDHLQSVETFASANGYVGGGNGDSLIRYIKNFDALRLAKGLIQDIMEGHPGRKEFNFKYAPVVELPDAIDPFLTELPEKILERQSVSDVDTLFGFNSAEAITMTASEVLNPLLLEPFDRAFEFELPRGNLKLDYNSNDYKRIAKDARQFYFPENATVSKDTINEYVALLSDTWMNYGIINAANLQHKHSTGKTFLYQLSLVTDISILKSLLGFDPHAVRGAAHADDLVYLFKIEENLFGSDFTEIHKNLSPDSFEAKSIRFLSKLWTNFAKYGTPTTSTDSARFQPIENNRLNYGDITNDGLIAGVNPLSERMNFWNNLYRQNGKVFQNTDKIRDEYCRFNSKI